MSQTAFDSHQFVKRIVSAGFTEPQAEVLAESLQGAFFGNLATKDDMEVVKSDIDELKSDVAILKSDMQLVRQEMKALEVKMNIGFTKIEVRFAEIEVRFARMEMVMYRAVAFAVAMTVGLITLIDYLLK